MADTHEMPTEILRTTEQTPLLDPGRYFTTTIKHEPVVSTEYVTPTRDDVAQVTQVSERKIGWSSAYILVISRVIGSGIFAMPGVVVQSVGSPGLALCLWLFGALVALAGLLIDVEYGAMLPRSGGIKVYLEYTYQWPRFLTSTLVAVYIVLLGFTASNCIIFAKYALFATNVRPTDFATKVVAASLLTLVTIIHGCFYRTGIYIQNVLGWLKMALALFMIVAGFGVLFRQHESALTWNNLWLDSNWEWSALSATFLKVLYSYAGLENVNNVMNEVKNPVRTVKTVGPTALFTACSMYLLINIAYLSVVPLQEVKQSRELIAALFFERLGFGRAFLPTAIALSAAGNVMVVTFSLEIARQGFLPYSHLLASNRPYGSPLGALAIHYVPSFLVIVLSSSQSIYSFVAEVEGYAGQFFSLAVASGLIVLRYKQPNLYRPFRVWLPAVWLRILLAVSLILAPWFSIRFTSGGFDLGPSLYALIGIAVLSFGVFYWFILTQLIPTVQGTVLVETKETMADGTRITKLVARPVMLAERE